MDRNRYDLPPEEIAAVRSPPSLLEEALAALEADHQFLLRDDVFTSDVIGTHLAQKRMCDPNEIRLRPHSYEVVLHYDV